jgi:hypothetical protein
LTLANLVQVQPTKRKIDPRGIFLLLIMIVVAGYLIAIHHTPGVKDTTTMTNTLNVVPDNLHDLKRVDSWVTKLHRNNFNLN